MADLGYGIEDELSKHPQGRVIAHGLRGIVRRPIADQLDEIGVRPRDISTIWFPMRISIISEMSICSKIQDGLLSGPNSRPCSDRSLKNSAIRYSTTRR